MKISRSAYNGWRLGFGMATDEVHLNRRAPSAKNRHLLTILNRHRITFKRAAELIHHFVTENDLRKIANKIEYAPIQPAIARLILCVRYRERVAHGNETEIAMRQAEILNFLEGTAGEI